MNWNFWYSLFPTGDPFVILRFLFIISVCQFQRKIIFFFCFFLLFSFSSVSLYCHLNLSFPFNSGRYFVKLFLRLYNRVCLNFAVLETIQVFVKLYQELFEFYIFPITNHLIQMSFVLKFSSFTKDTLHVIALQ